jgi:Pectate lyase superfamily protein
LAATAFGAVNAAAALFPTPVKTAAYTAVPGDFVVASISAGGFTITLPDAPANGTRCGAKIITTSTGSANTLTVTTQGTDVFNQSGGTASMTLTLTGQGITFLYAAGIWYVTGDDVPLGSVRNLITDWINVKAFGAAGNGSSDDTAAINAAITSAGSGGGVIYLPKGTYKISSPLVVASNLIICGDGKSTVIDQTTTTADAFTNNNAPVTAFRLADMFIEGPGSGSGIGVNLGTTGTAPNNFVSLERVTIDGFGSHGLFCDTLLVSTFRQVVSQQNGADGIHITSTSTVSTSCEFGNCYALANKGNFGWSLSNLQYSSLQACASDNNTTDGYQLSACHAVTLNGCGCEQAGFHAFELTGGSGNVLNGCWNFANNGVAFNVTGGEKSATLTACSENSPNAGATASIMTAAGTSAVITNPTVVTAVSFAAGTVFEIVPTGGTAH